MRVVLWGCVVIEGGVHALTVTVAVTLSTGVPQPLLTRTQ
jgi:hypothetical protein